MKYMGSKNRISKYILPFLVRDYPEQYYVEPFAGGMNMIDKIYGNRIANDKNLYLIEMWESLTGVNGYLEQHIDVEITKEIYSEARTEYNNNTNILFSKSLIGWIGWMASFNGRFFDGGYSGKTKTRDYISEQIRNTKKQIPLLKGVKFKHGSYSDLDIPSNSIIYCDPPYKDTKQYSTSKDFNHDDFWNWVRIQVKNGHKVFISEYTSPEDFKTIWEKEVTNSMNTTKTKKPIEKIFVHETQVPKHKFFEI